MIITNGNFKVYAHINKTNGKMYIGVSCRDNIQERWKNGRGYQYNHHFWSAINKFGWDGFDHEIIASNLTKEEASNFEKLLIEKFDTINKDKGYNKAEGGYNNRALKGELNPFYHKPPIKAIEASVAKRKGKPMSEEQKRKIKETLKKATIHPNSLKALRESKDKKQPLIGAKNPKSVAVMCVETGVIYESQRIAQKELGLSQASICQALAKNYRAGNYHWKRVLNSNDQSKDVGSSESKQRDANIA